MNNQGWQTKEIENQPRLKKFNLKSNLTCNIYKFVHINAKLKNIEKNNNKIKFKIKK